MIKKQYFLHPTPARYCYFNNFVESIGEDTIDHALKSYKAKVSKSKYRFNCAINVKWYDEKLYALFIMRWS